MTLQEYVDRQAARLIARVAAEVGRLWESRDAEAIHDLRVSIRRFTQSLRAFSGVLPKQGTREVRRELKELMDLAGEVRSRDIALELFAAAEIDLTEAPCVLMMLERDHAIDALAAKAAEWRGSDFAARWHKVLELE